MSDSWAFEPIRVAGCNEGYWMADLYHFHDLVWDPGGGDILFHSGD